MTTAGESNQNLPPQIAMRVANLTAQLADLLASAPHDLSEVARGKPPHAQEPGVYAISESSSTGEVVYVGITVTGTLATRMGDHLRTGASSDLCHMVRAHADLPQDPALYRVRWLVREELGERVALEHFANSVLRPRLNKR